jgi:MYM-type Zinc finger with FCS sequence motif
MNTEQKRCENCKKLFGRRVLANGKLEYLSNFKIKRFCSQTCSGIALQAKRIADAETSA